MSRRRPAPSMHHVEQAAHDLLAGRAASGAGELLDCIHAINPTGRSLGRAEERRRYELKARLQSLLIRKFHDDLVVTAEAQGIVGIRHRYLGQDACHARIDELEEDARVRVRWLLDVAELDEHAGEPAAMPSGPRDAIDAIGVDPLAQGRHALAAFDYDAARAHFERAALGASGDLAAARALLELLVDHLALDDEALAIEPRLPRSAAADAEVRVLLAVAAARSGSTAAAQRLLHGLIGPRAADAWCALATDAIRRQAFGEIDLCLARLTESDPAHPELVQLREEANRLRADARRPAEQELLGLAGNADGNAAGNAAGNADGNADDAAVEAAARALLVRWPESPVAGRILGQIQHRRRSNEAERLLASTQAALADGELARAAELCRQARAVGADTTGLLEQLRAAEAARRRAHDEAELAAVCAQLAETDPRPGLVAFLALEPELRRRVRSRGDLAMLAWLEQASAHHKSARHGALIDAVLAIAAAGDALGHGDDALALAMLEPHEPLLAGVARASELRAEAQRRIAARRRAAATAALADAQRALAAGDLDLCEHHGDRADRRDLDAAQREQLDRTRHELRERRAMVQRRERVARLVAAGDVVTPRRELEAVLAAGTGGAAQAEAAREVREMLDDLRAELRRVWRIRSHDAEARRDHPDPVGELLGPLPYMEGTAPWLMAGGRELVVAAAEGPHVFLGHIAVADGRLLGRRYLRTPEPLGAVISTIVDGDAVWLAGKSGRVLQVSWTTGEPVRWASLAPLLAPREQIQRVFLLPGGSHLWVHAAVPGELTFSERVIDVEAWRVRRELSSSWSHHALIAGSSSCVIGMGLDGGAVRYTERGTVAEEITACARMQVSSVTVDPARELVVLGGRPDESDELEIMRTRAGRAIHRRTVPDSSFERAHRCASTRDPDLLVVHHRVDADDAQLVAFRFAGPDLDPAYTIRAPVEVILAQDADATRVVGLWDSARRVEITCIGAEAPAFEDVLDGSARWSLRALADYLSCRPKLADTEILAIASRAAARGDWQEVRALLEEVPLDGMAPDRVAHHCHLLGLAWLRTGAEAARARALWQAGFAHDQETDRFVTCRLDVCLELVEPMPDPLPADWWGPGTSLVRQLRGAIATADQRLAAGDAQAALRVMRRRTVTGSHERQSAARLAAAWLAIEPDHLADRFDKAITLARFAMLVHDAHTLDLPIEGALRPEQLTTLAGQAEQWLATWHERA